MLDKILEVINGLRNYNYVPQKQTPATNAVPVFDIPGNSSSWKGIVWHHSATKDNPAVNDWESIRRFHTSWRVDGNIVSEEAYKTAVANGRSHCEKPWSDIGYHLGIERENGLLVVKIGRPWNKAGAHAGFAGNNSFNENFLGCCLVGNFDSSPPDEDTMKMALAVTRQIMERFGIERSNVLGHREVYDIVGTPRLKTCPGSALNMDDFRGRL
jgi:hypothetical protein